MTKPYIYIYIYIYIYVSSKLRSCRYCYMNALHECWLNGWRKAWQQLHKNATSNIKQVMGVASHNAAALRPPTTHHENYQS